MAKLTKSLEVLEKQIMIQGSDTQEIKKEFWDLIPALLIILKFIRFWCGIKGKQIIDRIISAIELLKNNYKYKNHLAAYPHIDPDWV